MKNVLVGQSGGPTAVINSSLYGVISEALAHTSDVDVVYGLINGIEGIFEDRIINLSDDMTPEERELLLTTPGAFLGSCRYKLPADADDPVYARIFEKFAAWEIAYFFYIGGNDSMDTVHKLSAYAERIGSPVRILGLPKTVDNDLVHTDHTPGFGSAAKFVAASVREICIDASVYTKPAVTIVEIMGRHAGWLTAASALARQFEGDNPLLIYLPETPFSLSDFTARIRQCLKQQSAVVVCISEGIKDAHGTFICEYGQEAAPLDTFGHKKLSGAGKFLEEHLINTLGIKARSVEFNVSQRASSIYQSKTDVDEAVVSGRFAVEQALAGGATGMMVGFTRLSDEPYRIACHLHPAAEICNREQTVPIDWICSDGTDVTEEMLRYLSPLIQGETETPMENGVPKFVYRRF
ncbi:MAG: 6-phosphofructokinase [Lachnospiraceae bacterium]|nr:6-phosphofructokinase [Lachnospiraceae bacterium]